MKNSQTQKGNVLFLILIAVALFAALSYAVTQSSRTGGDSARETNILNAAQLTQYPTSVRTAVLRLIIDGFQDTGLQFNNPASAVGTDEPFEVFATIGGGAVFQNAPREMMEVNGVNEEGRWYFNMDFEVENLGRDVPGSITGNELIAFLPGITESVCTRLNLEAGIINSPAALNPELGTDVVDDDNDGSVQKNIEDVATDYSATTSVVINNTAEDFTRQTFGCFHNNNGGAEPYVFYSVILER